MLRGIKFGFLILFLVIIGRDSAVAVQQPQLLTHIQWTGTSWFGSPIIHDLGTGERKLVGTYYDIFVWDKDFNQIARAPSGSSYPHEGRIYPPAVCADLDGDGIFEIVVASGNGKVAAYEWRNNTLSIKAGSPGWPASACDAGQCPEVRGIAAGDLNGDGMIEVVVTTTQTNGGAQVFTFNPDGSLYQPPGLSYNAWPRYNTETGPGNDADANGPGNHGFGCFGLNVGIGNLNDDPNLEIAVTFDNHQVNVFYHDGVSMLASDYFTNRSSQYAGNRLNWGQFIRWFDAQVEEDHYHLHTGVWPHPDYQKWMQWTHSPPNVADLNLDGKNEVIGVSNVEMDTNPYDTKHHSIMVLEGSYGDGSRSARRLPGWENLPSSGYPLSNAHHAWYPPRNPPAPTVVNLVGDARPEILYAAHDGYVYCTSPSGTQLWRRDIRHGRALMYASEIMVADLNQDQIPELVLTTYGYPNNFAPNQDHGYLMILDRNGNVVHDIVLPQQGTNGNGKGAPAAPTVMDLNGDGTLEVIVQTFGVGCFVYTVPGSAENMLLWPTGRGNYLRDGRAWTEVIGGGYGDELAVDFGSEGIWYYNGLTWSKLNSWDPDNGLAGWSDGLGIDFSVNGTWNNDGSSWSRITTWDTGSGGLAGWNDGLAVDFDGNGLWNFNESSWSKLSHWDPDDDLAGWNGGLAVDFGTNGLWGYNGSSWDRITSWNTGSGGLTGWSGGLGADFDANGLWSFNGLAWVRLTNWNPEDDLSGWSGGLAVDFGTNGLWNYNGLLWTKLSPWNPGMITGFADGLAVDFNDNGLWKYDGSTWSKLSNWDPENMTDCDLN